MGSEMCIRDSTWTYNGVGWQATGASGLSVYTKTDFTATAAQTTFTVAYTVGYVDVYYNGSKLSTSEYTASTGTTVVLGTAATSGDIVEIIAWTVYSVTNTNIGIGTGTSLALGGATIGSNALAVTGTSTFSSTVTHSGATTLSGALTYGGVTLSNAVTGTGNMVLSTSPTLTTPVLGIPASGTVTNLTGTASININGTVGATTASTGAFTTFSGYAAANSLQITGVIRNDNAGSGTAALGLNVSSGAAGDTSVSKGGIGLTRTNAQGVGDLALYNRTSTDTSSFTTSDAVLKFVANSSNFATFTPSVTFSNLVGIGMTPSNILDITQNQNNASSIRISNSTNGGSSTSGLIMTSSASSGYVYMTAASVGYQGDLASGLTVRSDGVGGISNWATSGSLASSAFRWTIGASETCRITPTGQLKINTTSDMVETGEMVSIYGNTKTGLGILTTSSSVEGLGIANSGADTAKYIRFTNNASETGSITRTAGVTVLNGTSDVRLKIISEHQKNRRAEIEALWIGDFEKFSNFEHSGQSFHSFGIIAQQAHQTLGDLSVISPPENEDGIWVAPSEPFAFLALWGVKDLYKIIDDLTTRLAALEAK